MHAVSKSIQPAELIPSLSYQTPVQSGYWHPAGGFDRDRPYWLNYHQVVFRAVDETAELKLSDWADPDAPGGSPGDETLWSFVQVQPYVE